MNPNQYYDSILSQFGSVSALPKEYQTEGMRTFIEIKEREELQRAESATKWEEQQKQTADFFAKRGATK